MTIAILPAMAEALSLTRDGRLSEATALIKAQLSGSPASTHRPPDTQEELIDVEPERVTITPAGRGAAPEARARTEFRPADDDDGRFEERSYDGPAGRLDYRLYKPAGATSGMPLVVMLHGCTQSPEDFARGTGMNRLADECGVLVAYPRQTRAANPQRCWNWFNPSHQARDRGEPALIAGITRQVVRDERADATRVYVAGLSAGGAAAAVMAAAYPDLYAAVGVHSGLACGAARDLPSAFSAMRNGSGRGLAPSSGRFVPLIAFHGTRDTTVNEINNRELVEVAAQAAGHRLTTTVETSRTSSGRSFTRAVSVDAGGRIMIEQWTVHGLGHAWSGGDPSGSYTDPTGPNASREMVRFFLSDRSAAESRAS